MRDYISREAVEKMLRYCVALEERDSKPTKAVDILTDFYRIPAANVVTWEQLKKAWAIATDTDVVERQKGEWVGYPDSFKYEHVYDRDAIVCPFCEESWNIVDNDTERFNFCPNCGAKMDGERKDSDKK